MNNSFWSNTEWVSKDKIQDLFNESQFYEKALKGELKQKVFNYDNHLNARQRKKVNEPKCTRSQMVLYSDSAGKPIALVHQYKRRNGTIGGCGKPDPKRLFIEDKVIAIRESP